MRWLIILLLFPFAAQAQFCSYTFHAPISLSGVSTPTLIQGDSLTSISLSNCSNIHIFKCKIANNTSGIGISLSNCHNITIDSCFLTNSGQGIIAVNCTGSLLIQNNYFYNILGSPDPNKWHSIALQTCSGGGNQILSNKIENVGTPYIHDQISIFNSSGLVGDSILVYLNNIKGGQTILNAGGTNGANGITCGDNGGSYQSVRGNKLINTGYAGIQGNVASSNCTIDHNFIYSSSTSISLVGLSFNGSGSSYSGIFIGYNKINWLDFNGHQDNLFTGATPPPGWSTNTPNTTADPLANATMIPNPQVTPCPVPPVITYTSPRIFTVGQFVTLSPTNTGGTATSWTCSPTLPVTLSINSGTGVITGTLTATSAMGTYTVTATNTAGSGTFPLVITVNGGGGGKLFFTANGKLVKHF